VGVHVETSGNISKITPPYSPQALPRRHLFELLDKNRDKKLILILGQAAQGKSTLAALYAKTSKIPTAWMNLGPEDSDPVSLFRLITEALRHTIPAVDLSRVSPPPEAPDTKADNPPYRNWARSLLEQLPTPLQMIMDGLEQLSSDSSSFAFIQALLENAPSDFRLILLSREMPPPSFEFQQLKIRQEALVLTNPDLAFTEDEVRNFFKKSRRLPLTEEQLKRIHSATQGWAGGLILLAETLAKIPADSLGGYISREMPARFKAEVFQFLAREIFSSLSPHVQDFLVKSSMIDLIDPRFMRDLSGTEDAEAILRELVRKNLFVHSFHDETRGWLFQYHQLFRDFLKTKLESTVGVEERQFLSLKAGYLFEQRKDPEHAVRYFLLAGAYPQAASVIECLGLELLRMGRKADLAGWLDALPGEVVRGNPWLLFYTGMVRRFVDGGENLTTFRKAYTLFKRMGDPKGVLISLAHLIEASVHTGASLSPMEELIGEGEAVLAQLEGNDFPRERAGLWHFIGLGRILGEGDIRKGIWACRNAYSISRQLDDVSLQADALSFSALGAILLGEFSEAGETCKKIEQLIEGNVHPEFKATHLAFQSILANHLGDSGKTRSLVESLQTEIDRYGFIHMAPWTYELSGYAAVIDGRLSEAKKIAEQYLGMAISLRNDFLRGLAFRLLGLISLQMDDFETAREALDQSLRIFSSEAPSRYHLNRVRIKLGLVCTSLKEYEKAEKELAEALRYFSSISSYTSLAETRFAMAFLQQDRGRIDDAISHLRIGFRIAEEKKYEYLYNLGERYLLRACIAALELNVEGALDYAAHLLSTRLASIAEDDLKRLSDRPGLKETVRSIRRTIHQSKIPRLYVQSLGGFQIVRGSRPMEETEWDRNRPKELLKAILSHGGLKVSKDTLMDDLWPNENPNRADKSFKTALQRLRKSLEPEMDLEFGSSYIRLQEAFVSLDSERVQLDMDLFSGLLKKGEEKEKEGGTRAALSLYAEAIEIYKGDFLPDDSFAPWADIKRVELRRKYVDLLHHVAKLYETQGAMKKAIAFHGRAIEADPLLEESYQRLMVLYSTKGMQNEALRVYDTCKKALKKGLKSKPDPVTTALYNKILEKSAGQPDSR
jgi:LuxR family transcriptional regulator, maltose regulon positive regulatory protein